MTENMIWIAVTAVAGIALGWVGGQQVCRRKNAEEIAADLRQRLPDPTYIDKAQQLQLKEMRSVLNDAHKHILAVSKGLQKPTS